LRVIKKKMLTGDDQSRLALLESKVPKIWGMSLSFFFCITLKPRVE